MLAALPLDDRVRVLVGALESHARPAVRSAACDLLAQCRDLGAVRALTRASVKDRDPAVRGAALSALRAMKYREAPLYMAQALRSKDGPTRKRAIENLGTFKGDVLAARALADYFVVGFGGGPRVNFFALNQIAYIRDFDVEVAQNATIGDPIVGRIEEGVVQDHKILGGQELVPAEAFALASAFELVTGKKLGAEDPKPWQEWLRDSFKQKSQ
jgi:HEAT repeat protein